MEVRHRRIEREEDCRAAAPRGVPSSVSALSPRSLHPVRIADRRHGGKAVERAAQHDHQQARIAAFGQRHARQMGPGEQHAGGRAAVRGGRERGEFIGHHRLWNSGAISSSASACGRLSARLMVWRVSGRGERAERGVDHRVRLAEIVADPARQRVGDVEPLRQARRARRRCRRKIPSATAGRHSGSPSRFCVLRRGGRREARARRRASRPRSIPPAA